MHDQYHFPIYNFVFIVLVYRNTEDLEDFFAHLNLPKSKVIVVNSYYNDLSEKAFKMIAEKNNADFISVPNKGYGAGNNKGIEHALEHYSFKFLVVSNADIIIKDINLESVEKYGNAIIAPDIRNKAGKRQNPSCPFFPSRLSSFIRYRLFKGYYTKLIWLMFIWSRLNKIFYYLISNFKNTVFSAHGAFFIIPHRLLEELVPLFNEQMFLFNEEEHLGMLATSKGIKTYYAKDIHIFHKEDGSMELANINEFERARQSYIVYYEKWFKK